MKTKINFSVVITTYNRNLKLLNCIKSIENQIYQPKEIIIVNNYQKKITKKILKIKQSTKKIKIFNLKKNLHAAGGRNFGAYRSNYQLIAFLDDDDEWHKNYLNEAKEIIKKENPDFILTNLFFINSKNKLFKKINKINVQDCFVKNPGCMGSNLIIKKLKFIKINGFDKRFVPAEDRELLIRMLTKNFKFSISNSRVYYDPVSINSISKNQKLVFQGHTNLLNKYKKNISFSNIMFINFKLSKIKFFIHKNVIFKFLMLIMTITYFLMYRILR